MNTEDFRICISSSPDRKKLVAEVFIGDSQWAEINQEARKCTLELYPRQDGQPWTFDLDEAMAALQAAKQRLWNTSITMLSILLRLFCFVSKVPLHGMERTSLAAKSATTLTVLDPAA